MTLISLGGRFCLRSTINDAVLPSLAASPALYPAVLCFQGTINHDCIIIRLYGFPQTQDRNRGLFTIIIFNCGVSIYDKLLNRISCDETIDKIDRSRESLKHRYADLFLLNRFSKIMFIDNAEMLESGLIT